MNPVDPRTFRVCDADRAIAMDTLTALTGRGFLTFAEFEDRSARAAAANTRAELDDLFADIPPNALHQPAAEAPLAPAASFSQVTPADQPRRASGAEIRAGLTFLALLLTALIENDALSTLVFFTVVMLLWVFKVGPASWYAPSQKKLAAKQQQMQLEMHTQQTRMQQQLVAEQQRLLQQQAKLQRQQLASEVTDAAANLMRRANNRWKQH